MSVAVRHTLALPDLLLFRSTRSHPILLDLSINTVIDMKPERRMIKILAQSPVSHQIDRIS